MPPSTGKKVTRAKVPSHTERTVRRCNRSFTGCWSCRARKVKCDEATPICSQCQKLGTECLGYGSKLVWVTSDQKSYKSHGRRFIRCDLTWTGTHILGPEEVDHFVSLCNSAEHVRSASVQWSQIPFGVFASFPIPRSLDYGPPLRDEESFLFKHYVDHVALIMMPYDDQRNPWKSSYPTEALCSNSQEHKALFHAMIAQSALNLAHLGCSKDNLMIQATMYYALAISELRSCMEETSCSYASFIAAISTLMFVEVYSGHSSTWRTHFNGAWALLRDQEAEEPWNLSEFAWASTQSLCLINIVNETSIKHKRHSPPSDQHQLKVAHKPPASFMSSATSFGFTIGATQLLMSCIMDIRKLASDIDDQGNIDSIDEAVNDLYYRLDACREIQIEGYTHQELENTGVSKENKIAWYHLSAFIAATHIYLHRTIFDLPPSSEIIKKYVGEVFENVEMFLKAGGGNFSLWPAFVAAVEACQVQHVEAARNWLKFATSMGMGNRFKVKTIVEEVWKRKEKLSQETSVGEGDISVDWRDVMVDLDLDILLV